MLSHIALLPVLLPLIGAPACAILRRPVFAWGFASSVAALAFLSAAILLKLTFEHGVIHYSLGGWAAPWGIEYRVDLLNALVLLLVSGIATTVLVASRTSVWHDIAENRRGLFYVACLLCLAGMLGIAATGDAFNLFVFLEISSLSTYALVACGRDRRALLAAFNYLVMGTIGATFILIGIGFVYMLTGTLNMTDLAQRLPGLGESRTVFAAYAFIVVGVCLKLALFPLHLWLPGAYTHAPAIVTAFLAATSTKVALYVLIRFSFSVFHLESSRLALSLEAVFITLGIVAVFAGSLVAIFADNLKRGLAWSSIAQVGYMTIGIGIGTAAGLQASLIHLFNHALMKGTLFLALAAIAIQVGGNEFSKLRGIGRRMPWSCAAFTVAGISLIGIPGTAGFVSKWYLVTAALAGEQWFLVLLIVAGSLLTAVYIWRFVEIAWLDSAPEKATGGDGEAPSVLLAATLMLALANIYFGFDTRLQVSASGGAAAALLGEAAQ
ncbi:monovalent cation/H+ antiporter subunit D family protein [Parahaliea aestuarii]|uniref:Monovalent cation/H+ antiporter subunit D family protein n=1 Tax=Parahaliea aestuarii TaxID=1852021 RepID=A0A5C8ZV37_9GAMM|nr:monovalent cation/H+ antiporter subunit D family protein [Parahaliea aestuarii]TXS92383.1 monovalent cation/H+ antiporter subunit D family protein [Parahaliea aestuarii]